MNLKSLTAGIIIGALLTTTVSVFALVKGSGIVDAILQDNNVNIIVDGQYVDLPNDMHILNYNNRVYTPARLIAESLGATVDYEEARRAIIIDSPEPEEKEVIEEKEVYVYHYSPIPIKVTRRDISVNITEINFFSDSVNITFDLKNNTQYPILFNEDETYLEYDGERYPYTYGDNDLFLNSTSPYVDLSGISFQFDGLPKGAREFKINMPITLLNGYTSRDGVEVPFEFYVDGTNDWDR